MKENIYWFQFIDKKGTIFSIDKPNQYLSDASLKRREKQAIAIDSTDLPVSSVYINYLKSLDIKVIKSSKWLNGVAVYIQDTSLIPIISQLNFIKKQDLSKSISLKYNFIEKNAIISTVNSVFNDNSTEYLCYGQSENQIKMLNGHSLHLRGFLGQGIKIAVFDAGFYKVNSLPAFDSLWINQQIKGTWDFIFDDTLNFNNSTHGMSVLSVLAGNLPGNLIGTAPKADYWLFRTESDITEFLIEEVNWLCAAEKADSIGIDIISSSLGYSDFDDSQMNHNIDELDGNTAIVTKAADFAASKGIIVVTSAGNEGRNHWRKITFPADAKKILSVGAINSDSTLVDFSSVGNTVDGRIKPEIVAKGFNTSVSGPDGKVQQANGTSFACPIIAGLTACLWQSLPNLTNIEIINSIKLNASQSQNPDSLKGYGIPDFNLSYIFPDPKEKNDKVFLSVFPNPFKEQLNITFQSESSGKKTLEIFDILGNRLFFRQFDNKKSFNNFLYGSDTEQLSKGVYIVIVRFADKVFAAKVIRG